MPSILKIPIMQIVLEKQIRNFFSYPKGFDLRDQKKPFPTIINRINDITGILPTIAPLTFSPTSSASKAMIAQHTKAKIVYFIPSLTEKAVEANPLLLLLFCIQIDILSRQSGIDCHRSRLVLLANHITPSIYNPICINRHTLSLRPTSILMPPPLSYEKSIIR